MRLFAISATIQVITLFLLSSKMALSLFDLQSFEASAYGMGASPSPKPSPANPLPTSTALPSPSPSPSLKPRAKIHFAPVQGYTKDEFDVLVLAESLGNSVLSSQCFSDYMATRKLIQTNGKTPAQVVEHLSTSVRTLPVQMYDDGANGVIGYRQPPGDTIYTNRTYAAGADACARASNLFHEASHTLGYGHDFERTERRNWSVPYSINFAFLRCCQCTSIRNCWTK